MIHPIPWEAHSTGGSLSWLLLRSGAEFGVFVSFVLAVPKLFLPPSCRYISILPAIPVTLYLNPQEALEVRHPQEANRYHPFLASSGAKLGAAAQPDQASPKLQGHRDVTLYK